MTRPVPLERTLRVVHATSSSLSKRPNVKVLSVPSQPLPPQWFGMNTANALQQLQQHQEQHQQNQQHEPASPTDTAATVRPRRVVIALYRSVFVGNMGSFVFGMHFSMFSGILEMQHFAKTIGKNVDDFVLPGSSLTKSQGTVAPPAPRRNC